MISSVLLIKTLIFLLPPYLPPHLLNLKRQSVLPVATSAPTFTHAPYSSPPLSSTPSHPILPPPPHLTIPPKYPPALPLHLLLPRRPGLPGAPLAIMPLDENNSGTENQAQSGLASDARVERLTQDVARVEGALTEIMEMMRNLMMFNAQQPNPPQPPPPLEQLRYQPHEAPHLCFDHPHQYPPPPPPLPGSSGHYPNEDTGPEVLR
ncbi:hypothetical protein PCANC_01785 [Puccinia coronata f. sp. avenae]|uniref:Uncharacterized protein n=1 Tax=Puccinia coronata f. sp. avenae TaxID=200324 RepID=A0A2N5W5D1_9BASI|nr:hypothetical protein PCANC_01785 [Puccinia coronata f. sp. avenae]